MIDMLLAECPLFDGISPTELNSMLYCLSGRKKTYEKDEYIFLEGDEINYVGIVLSGQIWMIKDDYWGNRAIIARLTRGELFGESFASSSKGVIMESVIAAERSKVLFIDYKKIVTPCASACGYHSILIRNMLKLIANKSILLTEKMDFITKRTTREKLTAYLSAVAKEQGSNKITIPFDRQGLADFLSVDRSALSRELSRMRDEGIINYKKNKFTLL